MLACFDPVIKALEDFLDALVGDGRQPYRPAGQDAFHPDCQYRTPAELGTAAAAAAVERIARRYAPAAAALTPPPAVDVRLFAGPDPMVGGRTSRHTNPAFDYLIELNRNRHVSTYFDLAMSLVHELAHVTHAETLHFTPEDVVTLATEKEYVGLRWSFEHRAFVAQLQAAAAICFTDLASRTFDADYRAGWDLSVTTDDVLTALHAGNDALARREIKTAYPEAGLRADWAAHHGGPAAPTSVQELWSVYLTFHGSDHTTLWGLP